jgi:hypothetical protein
MSGRPPPGGAAHDPARDALLRNRFHRAGTAILIAGLMAAILVLLFARPPALDPGSDPASTGNSKVYEQNLEHLGGRSAVLGVEMGDWWSSLWHGRRLAATLAGLAVASAGGCFFFAYLLGLPPRE